MRLRNLRPDAGPGRGAVLGSDAVMSGLVRTAIGEFTLEKSILPDQLTRDNFAQHLLPPCAAIVGMQCLLVDEAESRRLSNGLPIERPELRGEDEVAAVDAHDALVALLRPRGDGWLAPTRTFRADL